MQAPEYINNEYSCPKFEDGTKLTAEQKLSLWELIMPDPTIPSYKILALASTPTITVRHLNRLRKTWNLSRPTGRPKKPCPNKQQAELLPAPIRLEPKVSFIGVHIFLCWLEMQGIFPIILNQLKQAIEIHIENNPEDSFPLLFHRDDTLLRRFKALLLAPLFGIGKLIQYDVKEHALKTVIGRGYQSSTLNQFLGQLERINAAPILKNSLRPSEEHDNIVCFIDGHMIPFWSRLSMHKGKITMLGRIMPGSQAVVAHTEHGRAIFFDYQPPDIRLPKMILDFCSNIVAQTGIKIFVIDREVNSVAMAQAFTERGWGLLSMLDKNEYTDLSDWNYEYIEKLDDGAEVYLGRWNEEKKKNKGNDPRIFVLVVRDGRLLPFWGTKVVGEQVEYLEWPLLYSQRTECQENTFKRMKKHGALDVNFGTKNILSEDRHHQRKKEKLEIETAKIGERLSKKNEKVIEQEKKILESEEKNHEKRLEQRRNKLTIMKTDLAKTASKQDEIKKNLDKIGPPGVRADRDFRKQSVMTLRTLLLENMLMMFFSLLTASKKESLSMNLDSLIALLFERSGGFFQTPTDFVYLVNLDGLSKVNKLKLLRLIEGINEMGLKREERPVSVRIRERAAP